MPFFVLHTTASALRLRDGRRGEATFGIMQAWKGKHDKGEEPTSAESGHDQGAGEKGKGRKEDQVCIGCAVRASVPLMSPLSP